MEHKKEYMVRISFQSMEETKVTKENMLLCTKRYAIKAGMKQK